ncbi:MAG TPA: cytochrome B6, partial [Helicobacteraceae bacterium]|nr:cytochrome B6 [Helicobacteraceae bacterium]
MFKLYSFLFFSALLYSQEMITPIVMPQNLNTQKVALGQALFFDTRLSKDNTIACASCHILHEGGDDNLKFSFGINGQEGIINAPTVLNAVNNFHQFWDGRAKDLKQQVAGPIENPIEMGFNFPDLIVKLEQTDYAQRFRNIYDEGITKQTISDAIAEYEKSLVTPNAPFDKFLLGDTDAITQEQKEGYMLFKSKGCISCHRGVNVGGNLFSKFGVVEDAKTSTL